MITIITGGIVFKVKITIKDSDSNYNVWAHIFKPTDKMPIAGTCFNKNTKPDEVIKWAKITIEKFDRNFLTT